MDVHRGLDPNLLTDDYLLSEDIWKQFQIEEMQWQSLPVIDSFTCSMLCEKNCQVKYDCMWNGHCKGAHGNRSCNSKNVSGFTPGETKPPVVQVAQQSLLKPDLKLSVDPNTVVPMMPPFHYSIQTPPISDDEDTKPTPILQSLQSALSENELDDGDLSDYFKGDGKDWDFFDEELEQAVEEEKKKIDIQQQQENEMRAFYAATDHSYHKGNYVTAHAATLGIVTPSDSEEEIDVVSLGEKFTVNKSAGALPTNPSSKDRRKLQRTMQSRFPQGPKTVTPTKQRTTAPKKAPETRGRNNRQYNKKSKPGRQYKRRFGFCSDNEQEPSEKRHLHNDMERQRRVDLRNLFDDLKKLVPEMHTKPRAAKVAILRGAATVCRDVTHTEIVYKRRIELMRQYQMRLRMRLSKLRRDIAARRY